MRTSQTEAFPVNSYEKKEYSLCGLTRFDRAIDQKQLHLGSNEISTNYLKNWESKFRNYDLISGDCHCNSRLLFIREIRIWEKKQGIIDNPQPEILQLSCKITPPLLFRSGRLQSWKMPWSSRSKAFFIYATVKARCWRNKSSDSLDVG